ncbi:MAG: C-GCAxxG-C-C family protein [Dehalococcoidia bacterium]|jgi:C_GCAxxG_C_C family probable redox protein|nr:C-GCAxxG-C-C family protein [Dehalococcoidia bacterium]
MDEKAKEQVLQKAYDLAYHYEQTYRGCPQCVLAALQDAFHMPDDAVFKALSGFAGGSALMGDAGCGAYSGGIAFLSGLRGRERGNFADPDRLRFVSFATARKLHDRFIARYGTVVCRELHSRLFGRPFFMPDPDEMRKFDEAGGHSTVCPEVCGNAARWTAEIAFDEGLISEAQLKAITK